MSAPASSFTAVVAALAGNLLITVAKFVAFFVSGSGAMLSEAVHSAADAGNQVLLFVGLKRATREGDEEFHYGYGAERFVFGILSAAGIFFIGCGVTVYHGIGTLLHPHRPEIGAVTFAVLGLSALVEGYSMFVATRVVWRAKGDRPFFGYLFSEADPAAMAIVLEDGAALLGLVLAGLGIVLSFVTGSPVFDSVGSIVIGLLLGAIAVFLAIENREMLLGKAVPREVQERFRAVLAATPGVRDVHLVKTRLITPESFKLKAEVSIDENYLSSLLAGAASSCDRAELARAMARQAVGAISDIIDEAEARVIQEIPQAKWIDLEVDHTAERRAARQG